MAPLAGNAWVGVFGNGAPALFFELIPQEAGTSRTVVRGLELIVSAQFEIVEPGSTRARTRAGYAIALRHIALIDLFAVVAAHVASRIEAQPSSFARQIDVDRYLAEWIEFFALQSLSPERALGLWGELYILSLLPDVERGIACWVGPYGQMFDYMGNGVSLEIKTSLRTSVASFGLGQIEGRDEGHTIFVRVLADDANGESLDVLVAKIRSKLADPVQFDATLARTRFRAGANADMKLTAQDVRAIPNIKVPRPLVKDTRIRSVRYEVDVDGLIGDFVAVAPLLRRLMPRSALRRKRLSRRTRSIST
jgi:hypothetical protein